MARQMVHEQDGSDIIITEYVDNIAVNQYRYPPKAGILILNQTESHILMCQNGYTFKESNREVWGLPKGHVEPGETYIDTALREFGEETPLTDLVEVMRPLCTAKNAVRHINTIYFVFRMTANSLFQHKNLSHSLNDDGEIRLCDWISIRRIVGNGSVKPVETNKETLLVIKENVKRLSKIAVDI